jgi:MarR family 2-MHQ and catechol resistance regulon transcriptional repressor
MTSQVLTEQSSSVLAFIALMRSHAAVTRRLSVELTRDHGLTINDYEVLLRLARAPERRMRRVDLAGQVLLTPSGITRLLDGLERAGFVERGTCDTDRRVVYAVLTEAGSEKLRAASETHITQIDDLFGSQLDEQELVALADMTRRLREAASDVDCRSPDDA